MPIIQLEENKFKFVFEAGRGSGSRKRKTQIFHGGPRAAKKEYNRIQNEIDQKSYASTGKLTVSKFLATWIETYNVADKTRERYKNIIDLRLIPKIGGIQIQKLNPLDIKKLYAETIKDGRLDGKKGELSNESLRYIHVVLRRALQCAVFDLLITSNPAASVEAPRINSQIDEDIDSGTVKVFTKQEIPLLMGGITNQQFYSMVFVNIRTGLRRGELLGLRWQDIDFKNCSLSVRQAIAYTKNKGVFFKSPKTKKSRRTIDISSEVIAELKKHKKEQDKMKMKFRNEYQDKGLIFCQYNGLPMHPDTPTKLLTKIINRYNENLAKDKDVKEKNKAYLPALNYHCLRHTHASLLLEAANKNPEITLKMISERLGHSSIRITMDIYGHLMPGIQKQAVDKLESLLNI